MSLFEWSGKNDVGRSNAASIRARRAEWAINDRMPHADEPLFSSNRHCNMKHRQLPDKIIIRLITCQLQMLVVCLLIYSPPRRLQFQRHCRCVPSHSARTRFSRETEIAIWRKCDPSYSTMPFVTYTRIVLASTDIGA